MGRVPPERTGRHPASEPGGAFVVQTSPVQIRFPREDFFQFPPAETHAGVDARGHPLCRRRRRRTGALTPRRHVAPPMAALHGPSNSPVHPHQAKRTFAQTFGRRLPRSFMPPERFPPIAAGSPRTIDARHGCQDDPKRIRCHDNPSIPPVVVIETPNGRARRTQREDRLENVSGHGGRHAGHAVSLPVFCRYIDPNARHTDTDDPTPQNNASVD